MEEHIVIGQILKPQGIAGEVKLKPFVDDVNRFRSLREVYIDGVVYKVLRARVLPTEVYLSLSGVTDRNKAELLRDKLVKVDRDNAVELPEGRYFVVDVIGCAVITDAGRKIGRVINIDVGRADIYTVMTDDRKEIMFPLLKDLLIKIDVENKTVLVKDGRFNEVAVYED